MGESGEVIPEVTEQLPSVQQNAKAAVQVAVASGQKDVSHIHEELLRQHLGSVFFGAIRVLNALGAIMALFLLISLGLGSVIGTFFVLFDESSSGSSVVRAVALLAVACIATVATVPYSWHLFISVLVGRDMFDLRTRCCPQNFLAGVAGDAIYVLLSTVGSAISGVVVAGVTRDTIGAVFQWGLVSNSILHAVLALVLMLADVFVAVFLSRGKRAMSFRFSIVFSWIITIPDDLPDDTYVGLHGVSISARTLTSVLSSLLFLSISAFTAIAAPQLAMIALVLVAVGEVWLIYRSTQVPANKPDYSPPLTRFLLRHRGGLFAILHWASVASFVFVVIGAGRSKSKMSIGSSVSVLVLSIGNAALWQYLVLRKADNSECSAAYAPIVGMLAKLIVYAAFLAASVSAFVSAATQKAPGTTAFLAILGVLLLLLPAVSLLYALVKYLRQHRFSPELFVLVPKKQKAVIHFVPILLEHIRVIAVIASLVGFYLSIFSVLIYARVPMKITKPVAAILDRPVPRSNILAICDLRFTDASLSIVEVAFMATLAYQDNTTALEDLATWFPKWRLTPVPASRESEWVQFYELFHSPTNTSVITIRGTYNLFDVLRDAHMWVESVLIKLQEIFIPGFSIFPFKLSRILVKISSFSWIQDYAQHYQAILDFMEKNPCHDRIIVGHSLGGGIAQIVSRLANIRGVTFSPPGNLYSSSKCGAPETQTPARLSETVVSVIPDADLVPMIDPQRGLIQTIPCDRNALVCHSLQRTACFLLESCGDQKGRTFTRERGIGVCDPKLLPPTSGNAEAQC